jgi:glutathione S-transferase
VGGRLITIPISHFCEKARWALDRAGLPYVEHRHLQLIHVFAARLAGGGRTVPVLVTDSGTVLADSTDILRWADAHLPSDRRLYPDGELGAQAAALESGLDEQFGPDGRLWLYQETLEAAGDLAPWVLAGVPEWEQRAFRLAGPVIGAVIRRYLGVDARAAEAALDRVDREFDHVAERLSDGRRFLLGDRFTAADLTFAALAAPVLVPAHYGSPLPPPEAMPAAAVRVISRLREHPAGVFAERLYREERAGSDNRADINR